MSFDITTDKIKFKNNMEIAIGNGIEYYSTNHHNTCYRCIEDLLNRCIEDKKSKIKVQDIEFTVPTIDNYRDIIEINYTLQQLKLICKKYNLKINGKKDYLRRQCYNYMFYSFYITKIQAYWRKILVLKYIMFHGPGFYNRSKCVNSTDFISLDDVDTIPYNQFFSFKDDLGLIYGFDVCSIYLYYNKNQEQLEIVNPYTKKPMPYNVLNDIKKMIYYSKILKISVNVDYNKIDKISKIKLLELQIITLFRDIDMLGNYTNVNWFINLDKPQLIRFISELVDIWKYRANISEQIKREIVPPNGTPFTNIVLNSLSTYNLYELKKQIVISMEKLINMGINNESKQLGALYILIALTIVSTDAAAALPWLHESVR